MAGYSRLMGADEEGTLNRLKVHRRQLIDPKIAEHHGSIVKTTGDGLLAEFPSVVAAVRCAAEVEGDDILATASMSLPPRSACRARRHLRRQHSARPHSRQSPLTGRGSGRAKQKEHCSHGARLRAAPETIA